MDTGLQALPDQQRLCPCLSFVIRWFPKSTFLIFLFEPWRWLPCANLASPRQGRRISVGPPSTGQVTEDGSQSPTGVFVSEHEQHVIREQPRTSSTTGSSNRHTIAVSFFFTGPVTEWIGPIPAYWEQPPAYWEQPAAARYGYLGPVPPCWERSDITRRKRPHLYRHRRSSTDSYYQPRRYRTELRRSP